MAMIAEVNKTAVIALVVAYIGGKKTGGCHDSLTPKSVKTTTGINMESTVMVLLLSSFFDFELIKQ